MLGNEFNAPITDEDYDGMISAIESLIPLFFNEQKRFQLTEEEVLRMVENSECFYAGNNSRSRFMVFMQDFFDQIKPARHAADRLRAKFWNSAKSKIEENKGNEDGAWEYLNETWTYFNKRNAKIKEAYMFSFVSQLIAYLEKKMIDDTNRYYNCDDDED